MLSQLPPSKTENIVVQNLESELLIYDLGTNKVFCLNETSALVYKACDGSTNFEDFKRKYNLTDEIIFLALDMLKKENLLEENFDSPLKGINRREMAKRIGKTSLIALPIISSLMVPNSAMAAVSCGGTIAPNTFLGCAVSEQACLNMGSPQCQTCSATATFGVGPGACAPGAPFLCVCD